MLRPTIPEVALLLVAEGRLTSETLSQEAGISRRAARRHLALLADAGTIVRDTTPAHPGGGRGKRSRRWIIPGA